MVAESLLVHVDVHAMPWQKGCRVVGIASGLGVAEDEVIIEGRALFEDGREIHQTLHSRDVFGLNTPAERTPFFPDSRRATLLMLSCADLPVR